jgi:GDPmannose 4,6-dehydratase
VRRALIFGILGQAGSYLAEFLVGRGYEVIGTTRYPLCATRIGPSPPNSFDYTPASEVFSRRLKRIPKECSVERGIDLAHAGVGEAIDRLRPDEIYNFASQLYAPASWDNPQYVLRVNGLVVAEILEAIRRKPDTRFFQAGSAEIFGSSAVLCDEYSPRHPRNPYAVAKSMAGDLVRAYRERYGLFATTGIFFNMESGRRDNLFFARKVVCEAVRMRRERDAGAIPQPIVFGGGLDSWRDWGLAREYVEAAWLMLQVQTPQDYVIATGESHPCQAFVRCALEAAGFEDAGQWTRFSKYVQAGESPGDSMMAGPSKIWRELGWRARSKFPDVVRALVAEETERQRG